MVGFNVFPPGWDEERVNRTLAHYESQAQDDVLAETRAAFNYARFTVRLIPQELVNEVDSLLARHFEGCR